MKGFPNQVADLNKIETAVGTLVELTNRGVNPKDDSVWGPELVRAGVAGTGHTPIPVEKYLKAQLLKPRADRSYETTARGLRQLLRLFGVIDDAGPRLMVTALGVRAHQVAQLPMNPEHVDFWRTTVRNMTLEEAGSTSHPYQILLRLVARVPGISRSMCALALEARDDSASEMDRIVELAQLSETEALRQVGVSRSNWDNAKKVLPSLAEQLADVVKKGQSYWIANAPGRADDAPVARAAHRRPRGARTVTPETIARAGTVERFDDVPVRDVDQVAMAAAINARLDRLKRHNLLVQDLAALLARSGAELSEDPFDILAVFDNRVVLIEAKTLDGTAADQRDRVRDALSQLLYYEAFLTLPVQDVPLHKVCCLEAPISNAHRNWLNGQEIGVVWRVNGRWEADDLADRWIGACLK